MTVGRNSVYIAVTNLVCFKIYFKTAALAPLVTCGFQNWLSALENPKMVPAPTRDTIVLLLSGVHPAKMSLETIVVTLSIQKSL